MSWQISGNELAQWRQIALSSAKRVNISPGEVDWLLREVTGLDNLSLRLQSFPPSVESSYSLDHLSDLWERRIKLSCPIQYLVGFTPWRNFHLRVAPGVLIPRPETEYLIDLVFSAVTARPELATGHWVDLGTGSGAIALGLAELLTEAHIHAVDLSESALEIARDNIKRSQYARQITLYQGSWWSPLQSFKGRVAGMVSNPPYIPTPLLKTLQPEVIEHEPILALDGGGDGLDPIRSLIATSPIYLRPQGLWLIEIMAGQGESVAQLLRDNGNYENMSIINDFAGFDRYVLAYKKSCP